MKQVRIFLPVSESLFATAGGQGGLPMVYEVIVIFQSADADVCPWGNGRQRHAGTPVISSFRG